MMNFSRLFKFRTYRDRAGKKLRNFFSVLWEYVVLPGAFTNRGFPMQKGGVGKQCI